MVGAGARDLPSCLGPSVVYRPKAMEDMREACTRLSVWEVFSLSLGQLSVREPSPTPNPSPPPPPSPRNLHSGGNRESYRRGLYSRDFKKELWREASENALLVERQMLGPLSTWYPRDGKVPGCSGAPWVELMLWS